LEWFSKVWYIADDDKHVTAVNTKIEKAIKSVLVTLEYLLARYCWICHSPSRKRTAGIRWE
jgi:hypothetical protein